MISIDEVRSHPEQWINTTALRSDDKIEYREKKEFGNRHVVFENGAFWGDIHYDQFNATDFPVGTVKHFSNYVEEKTGIPQGLVTLATIGVSLYAGYKAIKWADKNL
ncbi:MAG: hypothetical protein K5790_05635 [Nitrosopumilus sp.]|uniref:hypothetical protein n=1 Tax=Nitrosopumilus sp. TaxID=2024843 RepID=UPI00247D578F|nr:hypothetical protein [Nitrosopumilus sp.]MCV0392761.1 hypothetical protein [Nitrosopumilus sp.]